MDYSRCGLSICPSIYLSIYLSISLSIYLVHLSVSGDDHGVQLVAGHREGVGHDLHLYSR
jgi:hypothetical protein